MGIHPVKKVTKKIASEVMSFLQSDFPDYEIEYIVAEVEMKIPQVGKGSLKVTMRKKNREQNTEITLEPQEPIKIVKAKR